MNRYFEDTRYHLVRAAEAAKSGVGDELGSIRKRIDGLLGRGAEPEPSRFARARERLATLPARAGAGIRESARRARRGVADRRPKRTAR